MRAFEGIKALNLIEAVEPYLAADELMIDVHAAGPPLHPRNERRRAWR